MKWNWNYFFFGLLGVCTVVQIVAIIMVARKCTREGLSMACVGSVCRCVKEVP